MKTSVVILLTILVQIIVGDTCDKTPLNDEQKLKNDLSCLSDPAVRPVKNMSETVVVYTSCYLLYYELTDVANSLSAHVWLALGWSNNYISWNPANYGNISSIYHSPSLIWTPSINVEGTKEFKYKLHMNHMLVIQYDGKILSFIEDRIPAYCITDLSLWPHDTQTCNFTIYLDHPFTEVKFSRKTDQDLLDSSTLVKNKKWKLLSATARTKNDDYQTNSIIFSLRLERSCKYCTSILTGPIAIAISLILLSFWINPGEAYRFVLLLLSLIIHAAYLQFLGKNLPGKDGAINVQIVLNIQNSMIMCTLAMVLLCIKRSMIQATGKPQWLILICESTRKYHVSKFLLIFENGIYNTADKNDIGHDWIMASAIIDRICFIVYLIIYILTFYKYFI